MAKLNIRKIIDTSFDVAVAEMKRMASGPFTTPTLNKAHDRREIELVMFGLHEDPDLIQQVHVPVTWTFTDEVRNPTEAQKVSLCKNLIQNGCESLDWLLQEHLVGHRLLVARSHLYDYSGISNIQGQPAYYFMISAAFIKVPLQNEFPPITRADLNEV